MAVAFLASSAATASSAAGASNLTTSPDVTISGSNVYLIGYAGTGDNTPGGTPTAVKWGGSSGESLTQIGTTQTFATNFDHSAWGKAGATAQTAATYCAWSGAVSETALSMLAYTGVDQTTSHGTPVYQTGHSASPSVTVTTTAGDVVVGLLWCGSGGGVPTVTSSQTMRASIADVGGAIYEAMYVLETTASGTSTTISASVSGGSAVDWGFIAFKLNAAAAGTTITPGAGTVTLAGAAPSAAKTANQWSTPAAGAVSLTGYAPSVQNGASYTITPGAGSLTITGAAPVLTLTLPAPGSGAILLTGYAPTVLNGASYSVTPGAGSVVLSGAVPSVAATANKWITPAAGALVLTGYAPSVQNGQSYAVTPPAGSVTITGAAPTVVRTAHQWITPGSGAVVLTGAAPSASQAGSWNLTPGAGAIQITGYAPTVIGPRNVGAGRSTGRRRRVVVRDRVYMVNERDIPALLEAELLDRAPPKTAEVVEGPKPRKRIKKAAQPVKTVEQVQAAVEQIKARIEPDNAWLMQALEAVAYRVLERLQDEEDSIMLLVA